MDDFRPSRRQFLAASGSTLSLALAGCSGEGETTTEGGGTTTDGGATTTESGGTTTTEADETTTTEADDTTTEAEETTTEETERTATEDAESSGSFAVKVIYDGEWQGAISAAGRSRSIQGSGTETVEISGDPTVVSANAQKQDAGAGEELTIQILKDGEVVKESSTTAEYGVAQATASGYDSGSSGGSSDGANSADGAGISVEVVYDGEWQGSISADGSARSVQGSGTKTLDVKGSPSVVSANAQKQDGGAGEKLTVKILRDGEVVKKSSTTAEYGMAQVTATL